MDFFLCLLLVLAFLFWRSSFHTDDHIVAWCRFVAAVVFVVAFIVLGTVQMLERLVVG